MAVVGGFHAGEEACRQAESVGRELAGAGAVLVCGGRGGVMEAACRGAKSGGGTTVGILPGDDRRDANPWVDVAVATGLGEARNALVVRTADALIAVGGEYGTLSEIALALKAGKPVVGIGTWQLADPSGGPVPVFTAASGAEAVQAVFRLIAEEPAPAAD